MDKALGTTFVKTFHLLLFGCVGSLLLRGAFFIFRQQWLLSSCGARATAVASLVAGRRL